MVNGLFPCTQPIVRLRPGPGGVDAYGDPVPGAEVEDTILVVGYWFATSGEIDLGQSVERVAGDCAVICEPGALAPSDRVRFPGRNELFEINGWAQNWDANPWFSPGRDLVIGKAAT